VKGRPDLRELFAPLDTTETGRVRRDQFAFALNKRSTDIRLAPEHMEALLRHFEAPASGDLPAGIDYRRFCAFCEWRAMAPPAGVRVVRQLLLHSGAQEAFARSDASRLGVISKQEFSSALVELGHGDLPDEDVSAVARLFELYPGLVAYEPLLEFTIEQGRSK